MKQPPVTIENIETKLGNSIIDRLKSEKWKVVSQYSPFAFDKGIDFDSYTLQKDGREVTFEWDNWFEWKMSGGKSTIAEISRKFSLQS